jgi:hypothetical protein
LLHSIYVYNVPQLGPSLPLFSLFPFHPLKMTLIGFNVLYSYKYRKYINPCLSSSFTQPSVSTILLILSVLLSCLSLLTCLFIVQCGFALGEEGKKKRMIESEEYWNTLHLLEQLIKKCTENY